jgi:TfoX/Sxy family transcriptional regulator of competence genes
MPYNEDIEARIQKLTSRWQNTQSKKMFGGVCHLLNGNMFCGVYQDFLILRLGPDQAGEALQMSAVRPFDITGKPMKGWVMVAQDGFHSDNDLKQWLLKARNFAAALPPKGN